VTFAIFFRALRAVAFSLPFFLLCLPISAQQKHRFGFDADGFLLNGKPFVIWSGEMHFQRIPRAYWRDRLAKARAMGLNTVATYVFWNQLEPQPGVWDFSGNNDLAAFIREAQGQGLFVILRPGPYVCAEWDFGGLPAWLLRKPDSKVRCLDPDYWAATERYVRKIASIVRPLQVQKGGPMIMLQIENEYGSYGNDREYLFALKKAWERVGISVPFSTGDGATQFMLEAGALPGCVVGLDPGANAGDFAVAEKYCPGRPAYCSEYYPGWLTHWHESWQRVDTTDMLRDLEWLIANKKSWNLYVLHGGTNFGWMAGANFGKTEKWGEAYQPDVTSYDYDSPISEDGTLKPKYFALQRLLKKHGAQTGTLPPPVPTIGIEKISLAPAGHIFGYLPKAVKRLQPVPMEALGQNFGFILYRTRLVGHHSGKLTVTDLHDYANVYVDGTFVGTLDRSQNRMTIDLPKPAGDEPPQLDILVEAMGRINYGKYLMDRKGITERVTLNGMTLMNWEIFNLPMEAGFIQKIAQAPLEPGAFAGQPGQFFSGKFALATLGDTFLDMTGWPKGCVWVNGHHLGRYWDTGPQTRLYLPATFLKQGANEVVVFDLARVRGRGVERGGGVRQLLSNTRQSAK
jgi:beta-galactosidase